MKSNHSVIKDMTQGRPLRLLLIFALPLMAGNVFQQLYTVTDTAIVGQALGVDALAALGTVDWFNWMSLGIIQGITQGFSILIAQNFGAQEYGKLRKTVRTSYVLAVICAAAMLIIMQLLIRPMLIISGVPVEVSSVSGTYLRVMFCGIPVLMAYNMLASVLRALGDSKTPLTAMIAASVTNIALDLLFVLGLHWGVAGAAAATVFAQLLSAAVCYRAVRKIDILHGPGEKGILERNLSIRLMKLATPMAFQFAVIALGGMIVQAVVNRYGVAFIAGYTATNKLYGVLEVAAISYGYAMTTFSGQNVGAGKAERVSAGMRAGMLISMITSAVITVLMFVFGRAILGCFIAAEGHTGAEAMNTAYLFLRIMSGFLPILYVLHISRSCIQGMGNTMIPMISGLAEFFMRTGAALFLPALMGSNGILFAEISAWIGADLILIPGYLLVRRKLG